LTNKNIDLASIKSEIRKKIIDKRNSLSSAYRRNASRNLIENFIGNAPIDQSDIIASFIPISGEIDVSLLNEILHENGNKVVLPAIEEKDQPLIFRLYSPSENMAFNKQYKIYEPPNTQEEYMPTVIIVPLVACDNKGNRIGFGGGFYDRTIDHLERKKEVLTIGLAYDFQILAEIPTLDHDKKLDCIITDKQVVICDDNRIKDN